jgi:hypothetical protein
VICNETESSGTFGWQGIAGSLEIRPLIETWGHAGSYRRLITVLGCYSMCAETPVTTTNITCLFPLVNYNILALP